MPDYSVGTSSIRIKPSFEGFVRDARAELKAMQLEAIANVKARTSEADATLSRWRAEEEAKAVTLRARIDEASSSRARSDFGKIVGDLKSAGTLNLKVGSIAGVGSVLAEIASITEAAVQAGRAVALIAPGASFAGIASIGSLAAGIHGIPGAFKAISSASADSTDTVNKQRDSLNAVSNAEYSAAQANKKLGDAYRDASRQIRDMNDQLVDQKLAVEDASLGVEDAAKNLSRVQSDPFADATARKRAVLEYQTAVQHQKEAGEKLQDQAQDTAEANRKGVAGSDQVVEAIHAQTVAQQELAKAQADAAASAGGGSKVADALKKLSPNARELVADIRGLGPAWHDAQQAGQDALTLGLGKSVVQLANAQMPNLKKGIVDIDSAINTGLRGSIAALTTDSAKADLRTAFDNTASSIRNAAKAAAPLTDSMHRLIAVGSQELPGLGKAIDDAGTKFDRFITRTAQDGSLHAWIKQGETSARELGQTAEHVGSSVGSIFRAAGDNGQSLKALDDMTAKMAEFMKSARGQEVLGKFFGELRADGQNLEPLLQELPGLLGGVIDGFKTWSDISLPFLKAAGDLLSAHPALVEAAVTAYLGFKTVKPIVDGASSAIDALAAKAGYVEAPAKKAGTALEEAGKKAGAAAAESGGMGKFRAAGQGLLTMLGSPWVIGLTVAGGALLSFEDTARNGAEALRAFHQELATDVTANAPIQKALDASGGKVDDSVLSAQSSRVQKMFSDLDQNIKNRPGFGDKLNAGLGAIGQGLFGVGGGIADNTSFRDSLGNDSQAVRDAFDKIGLSNDQLAQRITGSKAQFDTLITKLRGMGQGGQDAADKLRGMRDEFEFDQSSAGQMAKAFEDLNDKTKDATAGIDEVTGAMKRQYDNSLTLEDAQAKVNGVLDTLAASAQSAGGAIVDASGKIDTTTSSGRNLYDLIRNQLKPAWDQATAAAYSNAIQNGQTADAAEDAARRASQAVHDKALKDIESLGLPQPQADALLQHYIPLGKDFNATFTADTSQATSAVDLLQKRIDYLWTTTGDVPPWMQIYAQQLGLPEASRPNAPNAPKTPIPSGEATPDQLGQILTGHADGGLVTGPGTDTSDSIVTRLSNGEYVINAAAVRKVGLGVLDQINAGRVSAAQAIAEQQSGIATGIPGPAAIPVPVVSPTPDSPATPTTPGSITNPQAPLPAAMSDKQLSVLQGQSAVDSANSERNAVYANPASTPQDKQAADLKYIQTQNSLKSAMEQQDDSALPKKYTLPGIASNLAGILAQGALDSVGLGNSVLSDNSYYSKDVDTAMNWVTKKNTSVLGYQYTPKNLPSIVPPTTPDVSTLAASAAGTASKSIPSSYKPGGGAEQWRSLSAQILAKEGFPPTDANVNTMLAQINTESGGDPNAINLTDSNAQAGHPSQGILQTIPSTFEAYRDPTLPDSITDPAANMAAALRYYRATYGNDLSAQWGHGHGYADGGLVTGPGGPRSDSIKALLSAGEYVVNAHAAESNLPLLQAINSSAWNPVSMPPAMSNGSNGPQTVNRDHSFNVTGPINVMNMDDLIRKIEHYHDMQTVGIMAALPY